MIYGIDASRAFLARRTGIEEYAYQVIRHLRTPLRDERVILYTRTTLRFEGGRLRLKRQETDFELPASWKVRSLFAPRFFTHGRLSLEMLLRKPDVLFIPAHNVPLIHPARNASRVSRLLSRLLRRCSHPFSNQKESHSDAGGPKKTIVVVHGLEYEFSKESYSFWERMYMRGVIRFSVRAAERVIAVSGNTKRDLVRLYGVSGQKIRVVYEGRPKSNMTSLKSNSRESLELDFRTDESRKLSIDKPYLLFIGRIEERKNISRIIEAFEVLKKRDNISHKLVLVGGKGYGYERIKKQIERSPYRDDIIETGYVDEVEKRTLLSGADTFLFPTLYEGFGLPVIEAQEVGIPVVTSDTSSLPEVAGDAAVLVDPYSADAIADGVRSILSSGDFRDDIIKRGYENAKRFDWNTCAAEISALLKGEEQSGTVRTEPKNQRTI